MGSSTSLPGSMQFLCSALELRGQVKEALLTVRVSGLRAEADSEEELPKSGLLA